MPTSPTIHSLRVVPSQWIDPVDFTAYFDPPERPFEIDLGCGMGRFLLARAARFAETNFLGIDRQLNRIKRIDRKAIRGGLTNIRLLRADADYTVACLLPPQRADTVYIFYPDPWPKGKHHHNRLIQEPFLDSLTRILKPGGTVHIATDHLPYYADICKLFRRDPRFKETDPFLPSAEERTDFELIFAHKQPGRCSFVKTA